jgi:chaperonin GroES
MKIKPMFDCVFIEQAVEKHGLIVLPQTKIAQGTIVATGPGHRTDSGDWIKICLNVGDNVIFGEHSGQKVEYDGKTYLAMRERDVIGVLDESDNS